MNEAERNRVDGLLGAALIAHRAALLRYFIARRVPPDEAEDILQDLVVKLASHASGPIAEPRAYLYRMAENLLLDRIRSEGRRRGDPGQSREEGAYAVERGILDFGHGAGVTGEDQFAHRHAARVESGHERRHGSGRHESAGAVDIGDGLRHRGGHVGARMELEFDQRIALHRLRFDVLDARDIEKVVLVVVGQKPFHLRRIDSAVGLRDIDDRHAQVGKDVTGHAADEEERAQDDGDQGHDHGDGAAHGRRYQAHFVPLFRRP